MAEDEAGWVDYRPEYAAGPDNKPTAATWSRGLDGESKTLQSDLGQVERALFVLAALGVTRARRIERGVVYEFRRHVDPLADPSVWSLNTPLTFRADGDVPIRDPLDPKP